MTLVLLLSRLGIWRIQGLVQSHIVLSSKVRIQTQAVLVYMLIYTEKSKQMNLKLSSGVLTIGCLEC